MPGSTRTGELFRFGVLRLRRVEAAAQVGLLAELLVLLLQSRDLIGQLPIGLGMRRDGIERLGQPLLIGGLVLGGRVAVLLRLGEIGVGLLELGLELLRALPLGRELVVEA